MTETKTENRGVNEKDEETYRMFRECVNLSASELERHLATDESKAVGQKTDEGEESTGHQSGRKIVQILHKKKDELSEGDYQHMGRVVSYVKRHSAQRPDDPTPDSAWVLSLKNWGHDPLKGGS
jgi:hypothetical protein